MKKTILKVALAAVCGTMLSCASSSEEEFDGETRRVINMLPGTAPIQLTTEEKTFQRDNNQFTLNFLKEVNQTDRTGKGFIYSPLSITYVLSMVNSAAEGNTHREMEQTLGFHEGGIQAVNDYCKKLIEKLPKVDPKAELDIANAIFVNNRFQLKSQFQRDMQEYYSAQAEALDFSASSTLDHINGWCNEQTKGMIPTILESIDPDAVSYLLNAVYFKADWSSKFDSKNTRTEDFTTESGTTKLPMMHQNVLIQYQKNDVYSSIKMPYGGGYWCMTVMLPEEGKTTDDIIDKLAANDASSLVMSTYQNHEVDLKMPRYETDSDTDNLEVEQGLIGILRKMGIHQVFTTNAEVPNLCENGNVFISKMRQKAKIKVDEEGSEAAAVTMAEIGATSIGTDLKVEIPKAVFHANRPFVYTISESSSGVILFVGKFTGE